MKRNLYVLGEGIYLLAFSNMLSKAKTKSFKLKSFKKNLKEIEDVMNRYDMFSIDMAGRFCHKGVLQRDGRKATSIH